MSLKQKLTNILKGGIAMMINYFAMQIEIGWITLEQVPKKYREKVRELVEASGTATVETEE